MNIIGRPTGEHRHQGTYTPGNIGTGEHWFGTSYYRYRGVIATGEHRQRGTWVPGNIIGRPTGEHRHQGTYTPGNIGTG